MKHTTIMMARQMCKMHDDGLDVKTIAEKLGVHRNTVSRALGGGGLAQQRTIADRAEAILGGVTGPCTGNSRREAMSFDEDQLSYDSHAVGVHELTSPDPLDILIAEEEVEEWLTRR